MSGHSMTRERWLVREFRYRRGGVEQTERVHEGTLTQLEFSRRLEWVPSADRSAPTGSLDGLWGGAARGEA